MATTEPFIALLRGINVSGKNRIPMDALRALAGNLGWRNIHSYIQSGNLVFRADQPATALEYALEHAITATFALSIPVLVRTAQQWLDLAANNPFAELSISEGNRVMLCLCKQSPRADAATALQARAAHGERIVMQGEALWIHFPHGAGTTKLSPALLDRLLGSAVTARNARTVQALCELLQRA